MNNTGIATVVPTASSNIVYPSLDNSEQDPGHPPYEKRTNKTFSNTIVKQKIEEYKAGKYTQRYIEVYLDYTPLEGIITNLEYLEFKNSLKD